MNAARRIECRKQSFEQQCCIQDGGRPSGAGLPGLAPNNRKRLWSRVMVVNVAEKALKKRHVGFKETNASKLLKKCRNLP